MALHGILDAILAVATLTLRAIAILFTRFHPLGRRYLDRIYGSAALYLSCLFVKAILPPKSTVSSKRRRHALILLLFGWTERASPIASFIAVLLNFLSLVSVWDFLYRGHLLHQSNDLSFSRVGYVDETTARIVARHSSSSTTYVEISWNPFGSQKAQAKSQIIPLDASSDYVGTFLLDGLDPGTQYTYTTNASHSGTFKTAEASPKRWSLISTSCIKPFYPYNPLSHGLQIRGLEHLDQYLSANPVDMMLFLGDFIYIDLPVALGWTPKHYINAYRQVYASPSWSPALRSLPWLHVYDDHEIINDWAANETGLYQSAMKPFWAYHGHANPPSQYGAGATYYTFRRGDISFFVLDTRRYRSSESLEDGPKKTMLGSAQLADLQKWLETEKSWKVVVSSVPFTRNWRGPDAADSWSGYLWERDVALDMMRQTDGVIILSGDRHEHATTIFPPNGKAGKSVIEFSTSPLNQFFEPFDRFHRQIEDTDVSVYSHPWGNSKFGKISFDTATPNHLSVEYDLIVDGNKVWNYLWEYER
ncbi:PhoD-like phosphatase [Colletotrichum graminicola]|uniref:PhoD-like phosphatase n=1 Tax=Colletotrichum graminicola (strain M1.001 / M2 / FGSC 10212) TaxID=645133 RepID=E3Q8R2_COLGM|nr:PhoD-like phosphatase [Colletotrichum graminicola M1.001]EFQ27426.1 PhoD-like phosphatase [Colletotrichum graminicola M1.001]WDK13230.1 PhoD-like phosphatase [Colletotrichum graminicola]